MKSETSSYESLRKRVAGTSPEALLVWDLERLMELTWIFKGMLEEVTNNNKGSLKKVTKNKLFAGIANHSCQIDKAVQSKSIFFLDCWILYREIIQAMSDKGDQLDDALTLALARILFIATLIFSMPEQTNIHTI